MEGSAAEVAGASPSARKLDLNDPAAGLPDGAPDALAAAARGEEVDGAGESQVMDYLLGRTQPLIFDVPVQYDTPTGQKKLVFAVRQVDGERILELEKEHRKGDGPFAELNDVAFNAALVAEACIAIEDPSVEGAEVDPKSEEFIGGVPGGPAMAMQLRFKYQSGLLDGVAGQVRSVSGYNPTRVESANRSIRDAAGNS